MLQEYKNSSLLNLHIWETEMNDWCLRSYHNVFANLSHYLLNSDHVLLSEMADLMRTQGKKLKKVKENEKRIHKAPRW